MPSTDARPAPLAWAVAFAAVLGLGCGVQVYNFGGAGRGTQFHIPAEAAMNTSPVVQSWIAYSLAKSTCQLEIGGDLPSSNSSFKCELRPREVLVKRWATRNAEGGDGSPALDERAEAAGAEQDDYLDLMLKVEEANFTEEYVWHFFGEGDWLKPDWLEMDAFEPWRAEHLSWHRPETRIIGYWIDASPNSNSTPSASPPRSSR